MVPPLRKSLKDDGLYRSGFTQRTLQSHRSCQMDMGFFSFSVWILMVFLLGARLSSGENCTCPKIPRRDQTEPPADSGKCFQLGDRFRYTCIKDYVRKVGTSNLIICKSNAGWSTPSLKCIPHPDKPTLPNSTAETSTNLQSDQSGSTTNLPYEEKSTVQSTSQGTLTHTRNPCTTQNSTLSPITNNSTISPEASISENARAVGISLIVLIVIGSMVCLGFFLRQRRLRRNKPLETPEEMKQLNHPSRQP